MAASYMTTTKSKLLETIATLKSENSPDYTPSAPSGIKPTEPDDDFFFQKAKSVKVLSSSQNDAPKIMALHALHFFCTGKTRVESSTKLAQLFLYSLKWSDDASNTKTAPFESPRLFAQDSSISIPPAPTIDEILSDHKINLELQGGSALVASRPLALVGGDEPQPTISGVTRTYNTSMLGSAGFIPANEKELTDHIKTCYDLILVWASTESNTDLKTEEKYEELKNKLGLSSSVWSPSLSTDSARSVYLSLHLLNLIALRATSKDSESVIKYIETGRYLNLASTLVGKSSTTLFSINPVTSAFKDLLGRINSENHLIKSTMLHLIVFYCRYQEDTFPSISCSLDELEELISAAEQKDGGVSAELLSFLQGGCMLQIRYKGLMPLRMAEELYRKTGKSLLQLWNEFSTETTYNMCLRFMHFTLNQQSRKIVDHSTKKVIYKPQQQIWRYSRVIDNTAHAGLGPNENTSLLWRLVTVNNISNTINVDQIRALRSYLPTVGDQHHAASLRMRLFGEQRSENLMPILQRSDVASMEDPEQ